ncbi:YesL family protein [Neobacillus sp. NPDC097160]|uniref:YesL family protein n=1 Tax=Neobacillus sp. NPDC097160 TaxID=3364298 RepID=UPI00382D01BD
METTRLINNINTACDWVVKLLYLNLLWILFTIAGLVVAGIFPATVAMFTVMKGYLAGENVRVFNSFKKVYKEEFKRANRLGIVLLIIPIILYTDWLFTNYLSGTMEMIAKGILIGSTCLYGITLIYVFPVYLQVNKKVFTTLKMAFLIGITYPFYTFMMLSSIISLLFLFVFLPMAGYLFFASGLACIITFFTLRLFQKIEVQSVKLQKKERTRWVINN